MTKPNLTELGIDPTKLEDFSKPEHQEEFFKLQKAAPEVAREYVNLAEAEAWDENLAKHAHEHYEQYQQLDEQKMDLFTRINDNKEEFENNILPNVSDELVDAVIGLLDGQPNPELEALLEQANYSLDDLKAKEAEFQDKARELLDVILKAKTYEGAVEENRGKEIKYTGFESDPDISDATQYINSAFGKELLERCLISEIVYHPDTVNVRIGHDDYFLPTETYQQWKDKMPVVKKHKYRAESLVSWNTHPDFSKKFIPLPVNINSFYDEDPSDIPYLQSVPAEQRMKYFKLGTIAHEIGHHIYDYIMDADKREAWKKVVDASPALTDYAEQYSDHKLKYDEVFTEAIRLKTTVPEYLTSSYPAIDKFLSEFFPDIRKPQNQTESLRSVEQPHLDENSIATINESRKRGGLSLTYGDRPVTPDQSKPLGSGGSKEVYSVTIGEQHYALAIPTVGIDTPSTIVKKWQIVLREPENTDRIKKLGFHTNELCQLVPIAINGTEFPALAMKRFQDLSYEVRDSKNPHSSIGETKILTEEYSEEALEKAFDIIITEIEQLLTNHIKLNQDSFNLAVISGEAHLYLNDLGTARFESIIPEHLDNYIDGYVSYAIQAFLNGITEGEYAAIENKFDYQSLKNKLRRKLLEKFDLI